MTAGYVRRDGDDILLTLRAQPGAQANAIRIEGGQLKVKIKAPPVDGKANKQLIRFLAKTFQVPPTTVTVEHGANARQKVLRIKGPVTLPAILEEPT